MVSIYRPHTLIELAMVRSILAANDIPYFVHNGGYASLYQGIQMHLVDALQREIRSELGKVPGVVFRDSHG